MSIAASTIVPTDAVTAIHSQVSDRERANALPMRIEVGFDIEYSTVAETPIVIMLSVHPSRARDIVGREVIVAEPNVSIRYYLDSFGNVCGRLTAPKGTIRLRGKALVADTGNADPVVRNARQLPIDHLPDE